MSPMSWYGGSQKTPFIRPATPYASRPARRFSSRFRCESMTPFGCPVDPEVYWSTARSSGRVSVASQASADSAGTEEETIHSTEGNSSCSELPDSPAMSSTRTQLGAASAMIARTRSSPRLSRVASGG
jgi:hypothetical protein